MGPVDPQMPLLSKSNLVPSPQHWTEYPAWHAGIFLQTEPRLKTAELNTRPAGALGLQLQWRLLSAKHLPTELQRGQAASKTSLLDGS